MTMGMYIYTFNFSNLGTFLILSWRINKLAQCLLKRLRTEIIDLLSSCTKTELEKEIGLVQPS